MPHPWQTRETTRTRQASSVKHNRTERERPLEQGKPNAPQQPQSTKGPSNEASQTHNNNRKVRKATRTRQAERTETRRTSFTENADRNRSILCSVLLYCSICVLPVSCTAAAYSALSLRSPPLARLLLRQTASPTYASFNVRSPATRYMKLSPLLHFPTAFSALALRSWSIVSRYHSLTRPVIIGFQGSRPRSVSVVGVQRARAASPARSSSFQDSFAVAPPAEVYLALC